MASDIAKATFRGITEATFKLLTEGAAGVALRNALNHAA